MALNSKRLKAIRDIVRDRMVQSGVDNYSFVDGQLKIGSIRYAVEACGCGEAECDGLRLRRVNEMSGLSLGELNAPMLSSINSRGRAKGAA